MNRLILVDNAMANFFSHYFNSNYGIVRAAQEKGIKTRVISREIFDDKIRKIFVPEEILEVPKGYSHNGFFNIDYCATYASRLFDNFKSFEGTILYGDMIVFMTIDLTELLAIVRWILSMPVRFGVHFTLMFMDKLEMMSPAAEFFPEILNIIQYCLAGLQARPDVSFATPSDTICHQVQLYTTKKVELTGYFLSMADRVKDRRKGDPVVFGHLGITSVNKGFDIIYRSLSDILKIDQSVRVLLQVNLHHLDVNPGPLIGSDDPRATIYSDALSQEAYIAAFQDIDVFLLPYNEARYGDVTSGVFTEAMSAGKLVIVSNGTRMASELANFGDCGICIPRSDVGLVDGCREILHNFETYILRGAVARENWRRINGPDQFVEKLQAYFVRSLNPQVLLSSRG